MLQAKCIVCLRLFVEKKGRYLMVPSSNHQVYIYIGQNKYHYKYGLCYSFYVKSHIRVGFIDDRLGEVKDDQYSNTFSI